ncbi:MAG: RNA methyltransferase [Desulfurococcales archaeon]|nr:RNA methyltransferase [Desulfurococcales archaeon]
MDRLRLVLVGVEGAINLGLIARLCENFDVEELVLVSPKASLEEAREYAVRASHRLDSALIVGSLGEALEGVALSICTSARSSAADALRTPVDPEEAVGIAGGVEGTVALVMGRESVGLTRAELSMCDLLATIPSSPRYPALNLANATAIFLYEFYKARGRRVEWRGDTRYIRLVEAYARALADLLVGDEKRREEVVVALRRMAARNLMYGKDVRLLLYLLSRACAFIEGCKVEISNQM